MAPAKGAKRAAAAAGASPKKKSRVDPMLAGIVTTLQGADEVSEQCREMLVALVGPSLSTPKTERHSLQSLGVRMIQEMLEAHKEKLVAAVGAAQKELTDLEGSKNLLQQNLEGAQSKLEEKKANFLAAVKAHEEAKEVMTVSQTVLGESKDLQKKGEVSHAKLEKERAEVDAAYQEHFKAPMDAGETPKYDPLKPFIAHLGLEDSLSSALPSSCVKAKEQRGSFDELVLGELGKALVAKIESLTKAVADEAAALVTRKLAVSAAEGDLEAKTLAEKEAAAHFEATKETQREAEAAVKTASDEWATFEPRVTEATDKFNLENTKRMDFEEGTLKEFFGLRDKVVPAPVEEEAAPAGA
jgi:hypothetical protein